MNSLILEEEIEMPTRLISAILEQKEAVILQGSVSIIDVAKALAKSKQSAALIHSQGKAVGIITETDIVRRVVAKGLNPAKTEASSVMTKDTVIISPGRPLGEALYLMHEFSVHHIPVVLHGKPLGVICAADALASDLQEYSHDAEMLDHIAEIL